MTLTQYEQDHVSQKGPDIQTQVFNTQGKTQQIHRQ